MADYDKGYRLETLLGFATAELSHREVAAQAAAMWRAAARYAGEANDSLKALENNLQGVWRDRAFELFRTEHVEPSRRQLEAFLSKVKDNRPDAMLGVLPELITTKFTEIAELTRGYNHQIELGKEPTEQDEQELARRIGLVLNGLADAYGSARTAVENVGTWQWNGPRAALPTSTPGEAAPGGPTSASAAPADPAAAPDPESAVPAPVENPAAPPADPLAAAAKEVPNALDALSQATQSLRQLLGGGGNLPGPVSLPDPASAAALADYFDHPDAGPGGDAGLPSLAGAGAGAGGGGFGGGVGGFGGGVGAGTAAVPAVPDPASASGTGSAALPSSVPIAASGAAAGGGMVPPQTQSPHAAGSAKAAGGIKPGAAEHPATGRPRARKPAGTPGVSLLGRAGRAGRAEAPAVRRSWDTETDTVRLLDEELWQVDEKNDAPRPRAGH
jgi:hypothetical protein